MYSKNRESRIKGIIFDWVGTLYEKNKGLCLHTREVLPALKPLYKLGLVTEANHRRIREQQLQKYKMKNYFDAIIIATQKKQEQYLWCMKEMGTKPDTTLIVDDRITCGVYLGNQLGCPTCWLMNEKYSSEGPNEEFDPPDFCITSLEEILDILLFNHHKP